MPWATWDTKKGEILKVEVETDEEAPKHIRHGLKTIKITTDYGVIHISGCSICPAVFWMEEEIPDA